MNYRYAGKHFESSIADSYDLIKECENAPSFLVPKRDRHIRDHIEERVSQPASDYSATMLEESTVYYTVTSGQALNWSPVSEVVQNLEPKESFQTMLASQAALAEDWDTPEEDEAWANL